MGKQYDATYTIGADDQTLEGVLSSMKSLDMLHSKAARMFDDIDFFGKFAKFGLIGAAIFEPIKQGIEMISEVAREHENELAFGNLAAIMGENANDIVAQMKKAAGGMVSFDDAVKLGGKALMEGLKGADIERIMAVARASTKLTGNDIKDTFTAISQAVVYHSERALRSTGIVIDFEAAQKDLAVQLGKTKDALTEAEKSQAFLNATLNKGETIAASIGMGAESLSEKITGLKVAIEDSLDTVKNFVTGITFLDAAVAASKYGTLIERYGRQKDELDKLIPRYKQLKEAVDSMRDGREDFSNYKLSEFGKVEAKLLALQKAMNSITLQFGIGNLVTEIEKIKTPVEYAREKFEKNEIIYKQLAVKTSDWLSYSVDAIKRERDTFVAAGADKLLAEQLFEEKRKKLLDEFVQSRSKDIKDTKEVYDRFYSSMKEKDEDWVNYHIQQLEKDRVEYENAGIEKDKINKWVNDSILKYIKEYQDSVKNSNHDDIENASHKRAAYQSMYEALKYDTEQYYDFQHRLLEQQRDEEISVTGDITLAWEAYYARMRQLEEEQTLHTNDFVGGMRVYYQQLQRDGFTWAKASNQMMRDLQSGGENAFQNLLKGIETDTKHIGAHIKNFIKDFASMFLDAINKMIAQWLVMKMITGIGGMFAGAGGGGEVIPFTTGFEGGPRMSAHEGGHIADKKRVVRYHTGAAVKKEDDLKSDEVKAVLKVDEYVINDKATKKIGVENLNRLNATGDISSLGANKRPVIPKTIFDYVRQPDAEPDFTASVSANSQRQIARPESAVPVYDSRPYLPAKTKTGLTNDVFTHLHRNEAETASGIFDKLDKLMAKETPAATSSRTVVDYTPYTPYTTPQKPETPDITDMLSGIIRLSRDHADSPVYDYNPYRQPEKPNTPDVSGALINMAQMYRDTQAEAGSKYDKLGNNPFAANELDNLSALIGRVSQASPTGATGTVPPGARQLTSPVASQQPGGQESSPVVINQAIHFNIETADAYSFQNMLKTQSPVIQGIVAEGVERNMAYAAQIRGKRG